MAIIMNNATIPTNGDFIIVNGVKVTKVVANGVTVWEKTTKITPSNSSIKNYIDIQGSNDGIGTSDCSTHKGAPLFMADVWYVGENEYETDDRTFVIRPKAPYNNIKATLHWQTFTFDNNDGAVGIWVNGSKIYESGKWDVPEQGEYITVEGSSITIRVRAECDGWEGHWKTTASVCMYNVTLS